MNDLMIDDRFQAYVMDREGKQRLSILEEEEIQRQRNQLKTYVRAKVEATRLNEIHTAKKEYLCECCGKAIQKGTEYRRQNIPIGYGFMEGTHYQQRITHLVCSIRKEAER